MHHSWGGGTRTDAAALPWPVEGHRQERPHLKGSAGVSHSFLQVCAATLRDAIKMERTIVVRVISVS